MDALTKTGRDSPVKPGNDKKRKSSRGMTEKNVKPRDDKRN